MRGNRAKSIEAGGLSVGRGLAVLCLTSCVGIEFVDGSGGSGNSGGTGGQTTGGATSGGASAAGGSGLGGASAGGSNTGGVGGTGGGLEGPLTFTQGASALEIGREGCFEFRFNEVTNWQIDRFRDLSPAAAADPLTDLSSVPTGEPQPNELLFDAFVLRRTVNGARRGAETGSEPSLEVKDQSPVRVVLKTEYVTPQNNDVFINYTIWASGRIAVQSLLAKNAGPSLNLFELRMNHTAVNSQLNFVQGLATNKACAFQRSSEQPGSSQLLAVNLTSEPRASIEPASDCYWSGGKVVSEDLLTGFSVLESYCHDPLMSELEARADAAADISVGQYFRADGKPLSLGRSVANAEHYIPSPHLGGGLPLTVVLKDANHFEPGFNLANFPSSTFKVTLNGQVITQSSSPVTSHGVGRLVLESDNTTSLLFQYLSQVPANAPANERTFVIEPEN